MALKKPVKGKSEEAKPEEAKSIEINLESVASVIAGLTLRLREATKDRDLAREDYQPLRELLADKIDECIVLKAKYAEALAKNSDYSSRLVQMQEQLRNKQ